VRRSKEILNSRTTDAMREELRRHIVSITVDREGKGVMVTRRFGLFEGRDFIACSEIRGDWTLFELFLKQYINAFSKVLPTHLSNLMKVMADAG
jgi:hypothetical protein